MNGDRTASALLVEELAPGRRTRIVDVGANPLTPPPYQDLLQMGACEVTGFEPQPEALAELERSRSEAETYFPDAVGDGSTETLHIYRDSGLTSIFPPEEDAFRFLGRSRYNMHLVETVTLETRRLDDVAGLADFDLLKIDIQGGEVKVFQGAETRLAEAVAVIPEVRFCPLYEGEPMFGGVDAELRRQGFLLHKIVAPKTKVIPNSQIGRLKRRLVRNQVIDADAVYVRNPGRPEDYSDEQLKHLSILASSVFDSHDLALYCLDRLVERGVVEDTLPERYVDALPDRLKVA